MRMPDPGPFGETSLEANARAIVAALLLKSPFGGWVESVFTFDIHLFFFAGGIDSSLTCLSEITTAELDAEKQPLAYPPDMNRTT
jgi:hypothetical protein